MIIKSLTFKSEIERHAKNYTQEVDALIEYHRQHPEFEKFSFKIPARFLILNTAIWLAFIAFWVSLLLNNIENRYSHRYESIFALAPIFLLFLSAILFFIKLAVTPTKLGKFIEHCNKNLSSAEQVNDYHRFLNEKKANGTLCPELARYDFPYKEVLPSKKS
jgi:hypothetical protein